MSATYRKKLIEVALPLEAINAASVREKAIRHGHPSTLHLWWARRPLAAARAVLFAQLVDDPSSWTELFPNEEAQNQERQRLFRLIEELVQWENSNNETVINAARLEIARSHARSSSSPKAKAILAEGVKPEVVNEYLATELPPVHDPFAGGGTIPLEAQRLGLRAIATDLNPVAVMINKALIEIPPKFASKPPVNPDARVKDQLRTWKGTEGLAEDVRYYGGWMREEAERRIGHLYPSVPLEGIGADTRDASIVAWIWARTVASPDPACAGSHVPLVSTFWLSKREGEEFWLDPVVDKQSRVWRFAVREGVPQPERMAQVDNGTKSGKAQDFVCLLSGTPISRSYIRDEGKAGRLRQSLLAVVVSCRSGRIFVAPDDRSIGASQLDGDPRVSDLRDQYLSGSLPNRAMITGGVCSAYGLATWGHLFTARQLVMLSTYADLLSEVRQRIVADAKRGSIGSYAKEYADGISLYLAFAFDKLLDTNSSLCTWQNKPPRLRSTFGRQGFPMTWDFAESNPFGGASGDFSWCVRTQVETIEKFPAGAPGTVSQADAARENESRTGVLYSTDPPYYDNIGYAELSDFFYVWMRRNLRETFPELTRTMLVPKAEELVATPFRFGGNREAAQQFFETGLRSAFAAARREANEAFPLALFYAFKQSEPGATDAEGGASTGWETMLAGLLGADLEVDGTWPIRTELETRNVSRETNALASSIVLVCRKRPESAPTTTRGDFRRLLRKELPDALKKLQQGNIAPVDVAQASIGPGMEIFSRHKQVLNADGKPMTVREALQLINEVLDEYLASGEGDFDADTRFAITWYEQHAWDPGPYGDAETLAKARNVSVSGVVEAGICKSAAGKVRILKRSEMRPLDYDPAADERPTVWEFTQHMIRNLEDDGEEAAARLLKKLGSAADATRELAYRLYNTCERKKWAEDARSYNALILAWTELEKLAARMGDEPPPAAPSKPGKRGANGKKKSAKKTKAPKKGQQALFEGDD